MAKKNELTKPNTDIVTKTQITRFERFNRKIENAYQTTEKSMLVIAGAIAVINAEKLHEVNGYTSVYAYCQDRFGISRGSVSECIKVWEAYGDISTGELLPDYTGFSFSQLKLMRKVPDGIEVNEDMSTREIEKLIPKKEKATEEVHASEQTEQTTEDQLTEEEREEVYRVSEEEMEAVAGYNMYLTVENLNALSGEELKAELLALFDCHRSITINLVD